MKNYDVKIINWISWSNSFRNLVHERDMKPRIKLCILRNNLPSLAKKMNDEHGNTEKERVL